MKFGLTHPKWELIHLLATEEMLGYIPGFLSLEDPRSAREQFNANYIGGWQSMPGFTMTPQGLTYPEDPMMVLIAECHLREEVIRFYQGSWVAIVQPDGTYDISRMD